MSVSVGFVILSHQAGGQLLRLTQQLATEYDNPPIVCHHDFGQAPLDTSAFGDRVRFVRPHVATSWGKLSVVHAVLSAIDLLYEDEGPDWFFHLSAQDYPAMRGSRVREELFETDCDAFMDIRSLHLPDEAAATLVSEDNPATAFNSSESNRALKRRFYLSRQWWLPIVRFRPRLRMGRITFRPKREAKTPYGPDFRCFYGDFWFAGNRRVGKILVNRTALHLRLQDHLRGRTFPEESYFQTILANETGLRICRDNRRFAIWEGGSHPRILAEQDTGAILSSGAFFARKFKEGTSVLNRIDEALNGQPALTSHG